MAERCGQHCGWVSRADWTPGRSTMLPEVMGSPAAPVRIDELDICPGFLVRQAAVIECVQARAALEHGALGQYIPESEAAALEGAMLATQAFNGFEVEQLKKARARRE
jgi:hypothetical protein